MLAKTLVSRAILLHCAKNAANNVKQIKRNAGHGMLECIAFNAMRVLAGNTEPVNILTCQPPIGAWALRVYCLSIVSVLAWLDRVWTYRVPPPMPSKSAIYLAEGLGALCWYWIIYHCITEPDHIFGEFPYIDPSTYTDEELGIPPDSVGSLKK